METQQHIVSQQSFGGGELLCEVKGYTLFNEHGAWKVKFFLKKINGLQRQEILTAKLEGANNMTRKVKITFCIHHWATNKSIN